MICFVCAGLTEGIGLLQSFLSQPLCRALSSSNENSSLLASTPLGYTASRSENTHSGFPVFGLIVTYLCDAWLIVEGEMSLSFKSKDCIHKYQKTQISPVIT